MSDNSPEMVMCVRADAVEKLVEAHGLGDKEQVFLPATGEIGSAHGLSVLDWLAEQEVWWRTRPDIETNEAFRQIIPYVVILRRDADGRLSVLHYRRGKKGTESRLHGAISVGYGGHVNLCDVTDNTARIVAAAEIRELQEELTWSWTDATRPGTPEIPTPVPLGLVINNSNAVGRVHLGVVTYVMLPDDISVTDADGNDDVKFSRLTDLFAHSRGFADMEAWSAAVCNHLRRQGNESLLYYHYSAEGWTVAVRHDLYNTQAGFDTTSVMHSALPVLADAAAEVIKNTLKEWECQGHVDSLYVHFAVAGDVDFAVYYDSCGYTLKDLEIDKVPAQDTPGDVRNVRCMVFGTNSNGEPDIFFCLMWCSQEALDDGTFYGFAKEAAAHEGYEPAMACCEHDPAGSIHPHFVWESASTYRCTNGYLEKFNTSSGHFERPA